MNFSSLKKIELHRHLELCWNEDTLRELAPQVGIPLQKPEDLAKEFYIFEPMHDLGSALKKFLNYQRLLSSPELLERMAYEAARDAFQKENIRVVEFRYAPTFIQQSNPKQSFESIHSAITKGLERAEKEFPIATGLICIIQRILPVADAAKVVDFAIEHKKTFLGLDLADNEDGFDSKPFTPMFEKAKKAGLHITVHAGEINSPKAPKYVREAVEILGAERIGHGLQIYRDPEMMQFIKDQGVVLELCPTSNWLTNAIPSMDQHPFKKLMDFGIATTINTDDPTPFHTDLNRECDLLHRQLHLTAGEIETCMNFARLSTFISKDKVDLVLNN